MLKANLSMDRFRLFLLTSRLAGLVLGLFLSQGHRIAPNLPEVLKPHLGMVTAAIVVYQVLGGGLNVVARGSLAGLLVLLDIGMGLVLGGVFGAPYLLLGLTLPVLEVAGTFGTLAGLALALIGGAFYAAVLAFPLLNLLKSGASQVALANLQMIGIQGVFSLILLFLSYIAIQEGQLRQAQADEMAREKDLLYQEMNKKTQDIGRVYAEVGQRETSISDLENQLRQGERTRLELEDQLMQAGDDLERLRATIQRLELTTKHIEHNSEQRQVQLDQEFQRNRTQMEKDMFLLQKRWERESRLLGVLRELTGNLGLNDTLLALTNQLQSVLPSQSCVIFLIDEVDGQRELYPEVAASPYTESFRNRILQVGQEAPGYCVAKVQPLRIENGTVQLEGQTLSTLTPYEKSALVCPLKAGQEVLGAIYLGRTDVNEFSPEEQDLLLRVCDLAGIALGNSLEYQRHIQLGLHDPLTHLYNARYLEERLREEAMRGRRYTYPVSLILLEVDQMGQLEESLGPGVEQVVAEVADIVRQATRETDVPARFEHHGFGILCVHTDRERGRAIGDRIQRAMASKPFGPPSAPLHLTASIGVAGIPHDATSQEMLLKRAQEALELAQGGGGNRVCFWDGQ